MPDVTNKTDVFKFVALRAPMPPSRDASAINFTTDDRDAARTPVGRFVGQFTPETIGSLPEKLRAIIKENDYDPGFPQSRGDVVLDKVLAAARGLARDHVTTQALVDAIQRTTGQSMADLSTSDAAVQTHNGLWDRYYAFYLLSATEGQDLTALTTNLRTEHLLNLLVRNHPIDDATVLDGVLAATPVIDKLFTSLPKPPAPRAVPPAAPSPTDAATYTSLWHDLIRTSAALDEVRGLPVVTTTHASEEKIAPAPATKRGEPAAPPAPLTRQTITVKAAIDAKALRALSPGTQSVLEQLHAAGTDVQHKPQTVAALNTQLARLTTTAAAIDDPAFADLMPVQAMQIRGLSQVISSRASLQRTRYPIWTGGNVRGQIKPLGIGDLKVVKQTLRNYHTGEVAHIENVLRGEYFERKFRTLDRTEQTIDVTTETVEDTTKDTQTTERFELKKESEKTVQEQMSVQAGVTVSGSYGMVTITAHGDFAYGTSQQESTKNASNFAREVVDKSVSRIQKSVKEERITKTLHEVEEIDTHGLDNKGQPDNLTGVYRWVDKTYEAQIYNYGKRLMFEFIVPEPSAFFAFAQSHPSNQKTFVAPPELPPNFTHKSLTEANYDTFVARYQVQGCVPPPMAYKVVAVTLSSDAEIDNGHAFARASKELVVPEGYTCESLSASLSLVYENYPQFKLGVGADALWFSWTNDTARRRHDWVGGTTGSFDGIVPVSVTGYDVNAYYVNVMATCALTDAKFETWQIQTFEKIVTAYQTLKATYDQQVAQAEVQKGVVIHGQNPLINREIEKNELKKGCVKLLMDTWQFGNFDAMKQATPSDAPDFDIFQSVGEGRIAQFFEQAFEWQNITYLFYPYFWGRQSQWIQKVTTFDEDPLFTKFLQSGSARVVVPVHPGYKDAVLYFLENNGAIWNGGEPPRLNDPLFISLADELRGQTDDLQNATPEGDPWTVVLPTTLVYLQKDATLPTFP